MVFQALGSLSWLNSTFSTFFRQKRLVLYKGLALGPWLSVFLETICILVSQGRCLMHSLSAASRMSEPSGGTMGNICLLGSFQKNDLSSLLSPVDGYRLYL